MEGNDQSSWTDPNSHFQCKRCEQINIMNEEKKIRNQNESKKNKLNNRHNPPKIVMAESQEKH